MEIEQIMSFLGASLLLTIMPGPDNIFVLTESLTKGQRNGIAISIGLSTGVLIHTLAASLGLSIIIQKSEVVFSVIKYFGATYLFYLAYLTIKEKKYSINFKSPNTKNKINYFKLVRKGFLMNILNPKVALFFIAFLPQFISNNDFNITLQMIILGIIFMIQTIIIFSLIAILSSKLSKYINNSKFWKATKWSKVFVLLCLGIAIAY